MDYKVVIFDNDSECLVPILFVSNYSLCTVGFFEDFLDRVADLGYGDYDFSILEINSGI